MKYDIESIQRKYKNKNNTLPFKHHIRLTPISLCWGLINQTLLGGSSQLGYVVNNHGGRKSPKDRVIPIPNGRTSWLLNGG